MQSRNPAERLIVAADFAPGGSTTPRREVREKVINLAERLTNTGVYLKVNSALRAGGYRLIDDIHSYGLKVFADLKLVDITETIATDGKLLREAEPELVTVMCVAGVAAMKALAAELPDTEVLGVTILTSLTEGDVRETYNCSLDSAVLTLACQAKDAGIGGLIASPKEAALIGDRFGGALSINTPGIRPSWSTVKGDDQNKQRVMTPAMAIKAGADRIVVGRPITQSSDPYEAVMRTIDEIASAIG